VPLLIERGDQSAPLLAGWQYGLGRTAIFAADPDSLAALNWIHWDRYVQFWSQLISWEMRPGQGGMFNLHISTGADGSLSIEAEKADAALMNNLFCRITGAGKAFDIAMTPVSEALYHGESAALPRGKYTATLMRKAADNEQFISSLDFAVTGPPSADAAEKRLRPPNVDFLKRIALASGGGFDQPPSRILKHGGPSVTVHKSAIPLLLPIAILLLLAEVFVRQQFN
jgi:hypothetical protein